MRHLKGKKKLNLRYPHRTALIRNQVIHLITYDKLITTKARAKEVRKLAEKLVTIARKGEDFNSIRRAKSMLPYKDKALIKLFKEIAPKYVNRSGGYTRIILLGRRASDTSNMAQLEWV